jgi:hypothetical protein
VDEATIAPAIRLRTYRVDPCFAIRLGSDTNLNKLEKIQTFVSKAFQIVSDVRDFEDLTRLRKYLFLLALALE